MVFKLLLVALKEKGGEGFEGGGAAAENFQGGEGAIGQAAGDLPGFFQADDGGVSGLLRGGVLAGGFAKLFAGLGDVEDVVNDLEGEADVVAEVA